ncbi:hypothetical protein ISS96_02230 [Candidatus Bathyarchaeota archaeon]|nr:hypothetical protein [Candidatus Bathyarchaeota archaeon]
MADAIEFKGGDQLRTIAYRRAAATLEDLPRDIEIVSREGRLQELQGIGRATASKIEEYLKTRRMRKYEEELEYIPEELLDLLAIQDLGPKTLTLQYPIKLPLGPCPGTDKMTLRFQSPHLLIVHKIHSQRLQTPRLPLHSRRYHP